MFATRPSTPSTYTPRGRFVACFGLMALVAVVAGCDTSIPGGGGLPPTPDAGIFIVSVTSTGSPEPGAFTLTAEATMTDDGDASELRYAWTVIEGEGVFEPSADQATVTLRATQAGPIQVRVDVTLEGDTASAFGVYETTVAGELNVTAVAVPDASNNGDFALFADVAETGEFTYKWGKRPEGHFGAGI